MTASSGKTFPERKTSLSYQLFAGIPVPVTNLTLIYYLKQSTNQIQVSKRYVESAFEKKKSHTDGFKDFIT